MTFLHSGGGNGLQEGGGFPAAHEEERGQLAVQQVQDHAGATRVPPDLPGPGRPPPGYQGQPGAVPHHRVAVVVAVLLLVVTAVWGDLRRRRLCFSMVADPRWLLLFLDAVGCCWVCW